MRGEQLRFRCSIAASPDNNSKLELKAHYDPILCFFLSTPLLAQFHGRIHNIHHTREKNTPQNSPAYNLTAYSSHMMPTTPGQPTPTFSSMHIPISPPLGHARTSDAVLRNKHQIAPHWELICIRSLKPGIESTSLVLSLFHSIPSHLPYYWHCNSYSDLRFWQKGFLIALLCGP